MNVKFPEVMTAEKDMNVMFPEIMVMPVISTGHATEEDMTLCLDDSNANPVVAYEFVYGVWCHITEDDIDGTELKDFGLSPGFVAAYMAAKEAGFHYLMFDRDGPVVEGLPDTDRSNPHGW